MVNAKASIVSFTGKVKDFFLGKFKITRKLGENPTRSRRCKRESFSLSTGKLGRRKR